MSKWVLLVLIFSRCNLLASDEESKVNQNTRDQGVGEDLSADVHLDINDLSDVRIPEDVVETNCGNATLDAPEECDGEDLAGKTCLSEGHSGGILACTDKCMLDSTNCDVCGDGSIQENEVCDGVQLGGKTCISEGV